MDIKKNLLTNEDKEAYVYLSKKDKKLKNIIKKIEPRIWKTRKPNFAGLIKIIIGQQLSANASKSIYTKVNNACNNQITIQKILKINLDKLKECGVSSNKIKFIIGIARYLKKYPNFLKNLENQDSKKVIDTLTNLKGIGIWSASIFCLFNLKRPNIFVFNDGSIRNAISLLYLNGEHVEENFIKKKIKLWHPYNSYACKLLWEWYDKGMPE